MLTITLILISICYIVNGGDIRPTRLLPLDGSTVHCAGQVNQNLTDNGQYDGSINSFNNYSDYMAKGQKPLAMMVYFGLTLDVPVINQYFQNLTAIMNNYSPDTWYGIQMGLWFYDVDGPQFDCEIQEGKWDDNIDAMIKGFNLLGRPVWLRIGYEFNGQWTNFTQSCYIGAYQRITQKLREDKFCNKSCATVCRSCIVIFVYNIYIQFLYHLGLGLYRRQ